MASTFDKIRILLGRRVGPTVGLADIDEAAGYALGTLGVVPADPLHIVDADLAGLNSAAASNQFFDVAEWRMLEAILSNLTDEELLKVGVTTPAKEIEPILRRSAEKLASYIKSTYGVGIAEASLSVIDWQFQQGRSCPPYPYPY